MEEYFEPEISDEIVNDYDALQFSGRQDEDYSYSEQQQFSNLVKNADGKYACDRFEYKAKQGCHLKAHIMGKHEGIKSVSIVISNFLQRLTFRSINIQNTRGKFIHVKIAVLKQVAQLPSAYTSQEIIS